MALRFPVYSNSYNWHVLYGDSGSFGYELVARETISMGQKALQPGQLLCLPDLVSSYLGCHLVGQRKELQAAVQTAVQESSCKGLLPKSMSGPVLLASGGPVLHPSKQTGAICLWQFCESESLVEP